MNTTTSVAHRLHQARAVVLRAQLALTITQLLLWVSLIGVPVVLVLWARHRRTRCELPARDDVGASTLHSDDGPAPEAADPAPPAPPR